MGRDTFRERNGSFGKAARRSLYATVEVDPCQQNHKNNDRTSTRRKASPRCHCTSRPEKCSSRDSNPGAPANSHGPIKERAQTRAKDRSPTSTNKTAHKPRRRLIAHGREEHATPTTTTSGCWKHSGAASRPANKQPKTEREITAQQNQVPPKTHPERGNTPREP